LITVSGRPAFFNAGGEFPILIPQSLGTVSIEYKKYGTQVDFVPIVLGNGTIRLEVRPRVSEIDNTRSVTINGTVVPGLRVREVDTGVEMKAGQTLALAGLVQTRIEADNTGIPWLSDLPYLGIPFRKNSELRNEVELLILVTPQFVNGVDPSEVPPCGPGDSSTSPCDCDFYFRGYLEVPAPGPCGIGQCGPNGCYDGAAGGMPLPGMPGQPGLPGQPVMPGQPSPAPGTKLEEVPPGGTTSARQPSETRMASNGTPYIAMPKTNASGVVAGASTSGKPVKPSVQAQADLGMGTKATAQRATVKPASAPVSNGFIGPLGYDTP
jgi:pilus assembly protein CpaC